MPLTYNLIRWRRLDAPMGAEWTRVHRVSLHAADLTVCHRVIPAPETIVCDRDADIAPGAVVCRQCLTPGHMEG